ncbi:MAG: biotin--[acetyl-CoA-carboxylase] ligase [Oscillospiraceae bacterium]|nr:biotin--[acetyl-CoA-carboxylase] ligase [Oscillospiraceae bacterium]
MIRRIRERLPEDAKGVQLHVFDTVTSTNDLLREAAEQGAPEFTVFAARRQTAGKGRQGRRFYSPPQSGLYLSMLLRPQMQAAETLALTPMAAVAAAEAVEQCTGQRVQIKWVNDLLLHGRKICGILAESKVSAGTVPDYVIVGIGINLTEPAEGFPPDLRNIAGAVYPHGTDTEAAFADCAAALIAALLRQYRQLAQKGYLQGYRERLCVLGRPVTVNENGTERPATALAVDDDLRLLVRYADGTEQWRSTGEIRIRLC